MKTNPETPIRLIALNEVMQIVGLGRTRIYGMIASGDFPPPIKIGKSSRWRSDFVRDWIEAVSTADS
jgi:predicted DNA-binding transcriptional regulator AlpA